MHVAGHDLAAFGGSTTFTFRGVLPSAPVDRDTVDGTRHPDPSPVAAPAQDTDAVLPTGRLDLIRALVGQIVGRALRVAEIDAIAESVRPVELALDRAAQAQAAARRAEQREQPVIAWAATFELRGPRDTGVTAAVGGTLAREDGRAVEIEARVLGEGDAAVEPIRVDVELDPEGRATRVLLAGRALGAPGAVAAAADAPWSELPVRVHAADGSLRVTSLGTDRAGSARSTGPDVDRGTDMVA